MENRQRESFSLKLGQLFFSTMSHKVYDFGLYKIITPYFWQCPTEKLLNNYRRNLSKNHLEIGVGTAFCIENTWTHAKNARLALMDLNSTCLAKSADRLAEFTPLTYRQNILEPIIQKIEKFDSIGMNYVLHCIEGDIKKKSIAFEHIKSLLNDGGVYFGTTLLTQGVKRSVLSRILMKLLNWLCIFNNANDSFEDLSVALKGSFNHVKIDIHGSAVIFSAVK